MKNQTYLAIAGFVAILAMTGCSNSSNSNPPPATNAVSGLPATNELINNNPPAVVTNGMATNMPPQQP